MRNFRITAAILALALIIAPPSFAKSSHAKKPAKVVVTLKKLRLTLSPVATTPADLATSSGKLFQDVHKKQHDVRLQLKIPASTSLVISDKATAAAANIRVEFIRDSVVLNDCKLAVLSSKNLTPTSFNYQLHAKNHGKKFVKGECANGIPGVLKGDLVNVYGVVNATRVDIVALPQAAVPTPTPAPTPAS